VQVVHERAEALLADAGDGMGHLAHARIFEVRRDLVEVAGRHAHVRVADDDQLVAGGARQRRQLVDLRVHAGRAALEDDAHLAREAAREGDGDGIGGVVAIAHAEEPASFVGHGRHQLLAITLLPPTVMARSAASTLATTGFGSGA
jgi:hypothetical protein